VRDWLRRHTLRLAFVVGVLGTARTIEADDWTPSHHCVKPHKPYRFTSEYEIESFKSDVELYEMCIDAFVRDQKEAAKTHQDAAKRALDEWNTFVRFELR
jgi:hypothetical protein